jgi:hypothetical protein
VIATLADDESAAVEATVDAVISMGAYRELLSLALGQAYDRTRELRAGREKYEQLLDAYRILRARVTELEHVAQERGVA